jgi:hypothetical protein
MEEYLMTVNPALWTIANRGITFPSYDAMLTQDHANEIQRNHQAFRIIKSSLTFEEYDMVGGLKFAKEVWDTLFINHEGTKQVRERRIHALESDLNRFVIKEDESQQDMYNRLNKIINDRGGVPDLSVSGDKSDLVVVDPHDPTTTSKPEAPMQSLNQLHVVTDLVGGRLV